MNWTNTNSSTTTNSATTTTTLEWRVKLAVNIVISVVGFIGNLLVLLVLKRQKRKSIAPFEYFIGNLSIADLIMVVAYMIQEYFSIPGSTVYCKAFVPIISVAFTASMYTVTAIAIFREKAILNPLTFRPGRKAIYMTIAGIWIVGFVHIVPTYVAVDVMDGECALLWPSPMMAKVYIIALFVGQYGIPLTTMTVCYTKIVLFLKRHKMPHCEMDTKNNLQMTRKRKQDKEVMKISVIIVVLYSVLSLPLQIFWLTLLVFGNPSMATIISLFADQLTLLHSCCNPLVYGSLSQKFRQRLVKFLRSISCPCPTQHRSHAIASCHGDSAEMASSSREQHTNMVIPTESTEKPEI
ncbi:hypothetical protein QZH41_006103 [Actinostola sp. cb2023]|nr:hypothetical protein QZH41_006103 [Actinostola sp. cb2023]